MVSTMDLQDALSLAKEHAERHSKSFVSFFGSGGSDVADKRDSYDHVVTGALIYLVLGVTLQDSFISGLKIDQISWLDRALGQIIFWITVGLLVFALVRVLTGISDSRAFLVAFKVMPIAFLCGAYAASLGFFLNSRAATAQGARLQSPASLPYHRPSADHRRLTCRASSGPIMEEDPLSRYS